MSKEQHGFNTFIRLFDAKQNVSERNIDFFHPRQKIGIWLNSADVSFAFI